MHASSLYATTPVTGSFVIADTGHTETHEASTQCMHEYFVKAKPFSTRSLWLASPERYALIILNVVPDRSSGASHTSPIASSVRSGGRPFACLHADMHARQPMQSVPSKSSPTASGDRGRLP